MPAKAQRQPIAVPRAVPAGTPAAKASVAPPNTQAVTRPARSAGTRLTAAPTATEKKPACARPATIRAATATG
jgi:hypothetical protein